MASGTTRVRGLLTGEDVQATAAAMRALGASVSIGDETVIHGVGNNPESPGDVLDMGNSGTSARLILGAMTAMGLVATLTGDASLKRRPMARVLEPLARMGAQAVARDGDKLPLTIAGPEKVEAIRYRLPVPSAQVKSAILLAGLGAEGTTTVIEDAATRDHTERLLPAFGAPELQVTPTDRQGREISLTGPVQLTAPPRVIEVPSDPSSAAFPIVAALITPGSDITLSGVSLNPTRAGLIATLMEMGGEIEITNERLVGNEPVGDLRVRHSRLMGIRVPAERAPSMIDEYPALAVAASFAEGETVMEGLSELRVKESDRLTLTAAGLAACGVDCAPDLTPKAEKLTVHGTGRPPRGGATVGTHLDHRIAMAFLVMGLGAENPVGIDDLRPIFTSFPSFFSLMRGLGADLQGDI